MTATKLVALKELAARHGLSVVYLPLTAGFQVALKVPGDVAGEVVYTSWAKPARRVEVRHAARKDMGWAVREIIETAA
jgi:hypothetical protein